MKQKQAIWLLLIAVLLGAFLRGLDILASYENGLRGACCALFSMMANNNLKYGLLVTGGVGVLNPVWSPPEYFNYYLHHPPGTILIATLGAALGGTNPASLRLIFFPFSIGVILLTYRLARTRDARVAAAVGGIIALMPLTAYYGAFVNFEIPTLFFMLLAIFLFQRYLRRGRRKDRSRFLLAQACAVGCDWIALGLPFALMLLAPLVRRRKSTPQEAPTRKQYVLATLMAIGASAVVFLVVRLWYKFQLSRYGVDPDAGAADGYYLQATPFADEFDKWNYLTRIFQFSRELITIPVLVLAAIGLLISLVRAAKRELAQLDHAMLATALVGIANLVILGNHASKHDYYLLYAAPACALACGVALRWIFSDFADPERVDLGTRLTSFGVVALIVVLAFRSVNVLDARRSDKLSRLGNEIADHTDEKAVVMLPAFYTLQVAVRAGRFVGGPVTNYEQLVFASQLAMKFGMGGRPLVLLLGEDEESRLVPDFRSWLEKNAKRSISGPFVQYALGDLPRKNP